MAGKQVLITPSELVEMLERKVTTKQLANWRYAGKGPAYEKLGGRVVYHLSDVIAWRKANRRETVNT